MSRALWRLRSLLRGVLRRAELDAEMREEFRFHVERRAEDLARSGVPPEEAHRRARLEFGSVERYREEAAAARGLRPFDELRGDVRFLVRTLLFRDRAFCVAVLLTLGICIGANVAIYTAVEAILLRPAFEQSDRLVTLYNAFPGAGADRLGNSIPDYFLRREQVASLEDVALYEEAGANVGGGERVERVSVLRVTPSFFNVVGVEPGLGRAFLEAAEAGAERTVLLTHGYWREVFDASTGVLGRELDMDGRPTTIVGVLPESFHVPGHSRIRLVRPLRFQPSQAALGGWPHSNNNYFMLGRLAPGATADEVEAEIAAMNSGLADERRAAAMARTGFRTVVVDMHEDLIRDVKPRLYLLWGAVAFVLLIGCVNIANLILARFEARRAEFATRSALGAGHLRLARQVLTEGATMALLGGLAGMGLGAVMLRFVTLIGAEEIPRSGLVAIDARVLLYAAALALAAAVLFVTVPTLSLLRGDAARALRAQGRGTAADHRAAPVRTTLVAGQVALAFLLLVGAGLMLRSLQAALEVDPGFEPEGVLTAYTTLTGVGYPDRDARRGFYDDWLAEVRALPGVIAAGVATQLPFGSGDDSGSILPEGYEPGPGESVVSSRLTVASPGYFEAMGIELLQGRAFEERDAPGEPTVIVIDEWLARRYWPDSSPVGERMTRRGSVYTVVGVVERIQHDELTAAATDHVGAYYFTYRQLPTDDMALVARTETAGTLRAASLRAALDRVDPDIPLFDVRPLEERIAASLGSRRTLMLLLVAFGGVALLLAGIGTYGVLAYSVAQRRREIGIRIALGGQRNDIVAIVFKQGLLPTIAGLAIGGTCALSMVGLIESLVFEVQPMDPVVLGAAAALMVLMGATACLVPARRATRVDPVVALAE